MQTSITEVTVDMKTALAALCIILGAVSTTILTMSRMLHNLDLKWIDRMAQVDESIRKEITDVSHEVTKLRDDIQTPLVIHRLANLEERVKLLERKRDYEGDTHNHI